MPDAWPEGAIAYASGGDAIVAGVAKNSAPPATRAKAPVNPADSFRPLLVLSAYCNVLRVSAVQTRALAADPGRGA